MISFKETTNNLILQSTIKGIKSQIALYQNKLPHGQQLTGQIIREMSELQTQGEEQIKGTYFFYSIDEVLEIIKKISITIIVVIMLVCLTAAYFMVENIIEKMVIMVVILILYNKSKKVMLDVKNELGFMVRNGIYRRY